MSTRTKLPSFVLLLLTATAAHAETPSKKATASTVKSGYAPVNGLKLYYESRGIGDPLIVIHGGFGASETFGPNLELLAEHRRVISIDLQAHGRTADIDRPMSFDGMADDVGLLIQDLKLAKADVLGYSFGGAVAMRTAIRHPDQVRKLVIVSSPARREGWYPEMNAGMAQMGPKAVEPMKKLPVYAMYARLAPRVADFPILVTKMGVLMRQDYDWSKEVAALPMPVMFVVGDSDAVQLSYVVEEFGLFGGGKHDAGWDGAARAKADLAILPHTTHYEIFASPMLAAAVEPFLARPTSQSAKR
jgi:pimeloyl-ACP methyl ester carboxylesterase